MKEPRDSKGESVLRCVTQDRGIWGFFSPLFRLLSSGVARADHPSAYYDSGTSFKPDALPNPTLPTGSSNLPVAEVGCLTGN